MKKLIELKSLTAGYEDKPVITDVSLTIFDKDFLGIIGPNGGGKTTLLKVILGLIKPWQGRIEYFMRNKKSSLGYLPQFKLFDYSFPITVQDVVLSGLAGRTGVLHGFSVKDKKTARELLMRMGAVDLIHRPIGTLSGGQMQRVLLCRALISSPRLLILDEPNTFIDKKFESEFFNILKDLNKELAIILVSHDIGMISSYVKNIACVNNRLYYHGKKECGPALLDETHTCPMEMITHGHLPHRVLKEHE